MQFGKYVRTFWRILLPPASESTLETEVAGYFETLTRYYQTTRCHTAEPHFDLSTGMCVAGVQCTAVTLRQ